MKTTEREEAGADEDDEPEEVVVDWQLMQSVFDHEDYLGGPGAFAFHPDAHRAPDDDRWTEADARQLRAEWAGAWADDDGDVGIAYSRSHLLRTKCLAEAFPESVHLYVHRHPVIDALETRQLTEDHSQPLDVLVRHWLVTYRQLLRDVSDLENCFVVPFHELRRRPNEILGDVFEAAGLEPTRVDPADLRQVGREGWAGWRERSKERREPVLDLEDEIRSFGYTFDGPAPVAEPDVEAIRNDGRGGADPLDRNSDLLDHEDVTPGRPRTAVTQNATAPSDPQRLLFVTFGTRGDVQPCIALARGFQARGYDVTVCSNGVHRDLVERYDIPFADVHPEARIDPPIQPDLSEKDQMEETFEELARFYDEHAEDVVRTIDGEIDAADCVFCGSVVFFRGLLYHHYDVPIVDLRFSPLHTEVEGETERRSVERYFENAMNQAAAVENFKIGHALDEALEALDIPYRHGDEEMLDAFPRMKASLTLRGFSPRVGDNDIPGLPDETTGFWQLDGSADLADVDPQTSAFVENGRAPVCLNFGSASVYGEDGAPWIGAVLQALRDSDERVLAIGADVPDSVRTWAHHVEEVPHEAVFPHCEAVVHHGGAGTTAACLRAGTPAVVAPPVTWADCPDWADWVEREGAGVHVRDPESEFADALEDVVTDDSYAEEAERLADRLAEEAGVEAAIGAVEDHFDAPDPARANDNEAFAHIDSLPVASWRKLALAGIPLFREPDRFAGQTARLRDDLLDALEDATNEVPVYKEDWPAKNEELDLERHDLPHDSSGTEWWYFHTHLETESGTDLSLFSVLFERFIDDDRLGFAHSGALEDATGTHYMRSIGDPRGPDHASETLENAPATDYFKRALREIYEKDVFPAPDEKADEPAQIPRDEFDYRLDDVEITKDGEDYLVEMEPDDGGDGTDDGSFGFELRFEPRKEPILNMADGVVRGVSNDANMFYYSITRMDVSGHVVLDGEREAVSGSGWYDHEFGGSKENHGALGEANEWLWMGIQLDDGSEIVYSTVRDLKDDETLHENDVVFIDSDGTRTLHESDIEATDTWSSMRTYTEYQTGWELEIPDLDITVEIEAAADDQEFQSIIANPAYWEGRIRVRGEREGEPITGTGIAEEHGQGGDRSHYRSYLDDVSREVQRSVRDALPKDPDRDHLQELVADDDHEMMVEGIDADIFVDEIVEPIREVVDRGGKGWRSMVLLVCADAIGGDPHEIDHALAFPELIHTGSLMVDDIQDNSATRRGGPAAHKVYGEDTAINAGTAAYFLGEEYILSRIDATDEQKQRIYELHFLCLRGAHTGQAMDLHGFGHKLPACIESGDFDPVWENLKATHRLKSAVPAMTAARMGVVAAEGSLEAERTIGDYFYALGLAFQMVDDAINLRGFEHDLKEHAEDLREGKVTAPVLRAFEVLDDPGRQELWEHMQADPEEMDIGAVLDIVEGCGAVDWCHDRAREIVEEAWDPVDELLEESHAKLMLRAFSWFVVDVRDY